MNRRVDVKPRFARLAEFSPMRLFPWMRNHFRVARSSLKRLLREPLQTGLTVSVIAIALALPTLLLQLAAMGGSALGQIGNTSDINVYFNLGIEQSVVEDFATAWQNDNRVAVVEIISPAQGLQEFERFSGLGSILSDFEENPLPFVVRIEPAERLSNQSAELRLLLQALDAGENVDRALLDLVWLDRLNAIVSFVDRLSYAVGFLLAVGILLILGNTVRLTIENRREEIVVIKLVGGTDRFVRRPLIYSGFWYGLLGGVAAAILVALVGFLLSFPLQRILLSYQSSVSSMPGVSFDILLKLTFVGAALGCGGAWLSVLQHLRNIEPQ